MNALIDWLPALSSAFILGAMGSGHCIGMCGGIACALGLQNSRSIGTLLIYHAGRITSYALLALIFGAALQHITHRFPFFRLYCAQLRAYCYWQWHYTLRSGGAALHNWKALAHAGGNPYSNSPNLYCQPLRCLKFLPWVYCGDGCPVPWCTARWHGVRAERRPLNPLC